jgi:hypothetical protein
MSWQARLPAEITQKVYAQPADRATVKGHT